MGSNLTLQKRFWCQCGYFSVNSRSLLTAEKKKRTNCMLRIIRKGIDNKIEKHHYATE